MGEAQAKNPHFSQSAFAKKVGIAPSTLSEVLSGKRRVSFEKANEITLRLGLSDEQRDEILSSFSPILKRDGKFRKSNYQQKVERELTRTQFEVISEWTHYALLALFETKGFKSCHDFMAKKLGISSSKLLRTLQNLIDVSLVKVNTRGEYEKTVYNITTTDNIKDFTIQKAHLGDLKLIAEKIELDVEYRDYSALTFPTDPKLLDKAREILRNAQDEIEKLMQEEGKPEEVYKLSCFFYPLTTLQNQTVLNKDIANII